MEPEYYRGEKSSSYRDIEMEEGFIGIKTFNLNKI